MKQADQLHQGPRALMGVATAILIGISLLTANGCGGSGAKSGATTTTGARSGSSAAVTAPSSTPGRATTPAAPTIPKDAQTARFVSTAEAICKRLNARLKNANAKLPKKTGQLTISEIIKGAPGNALMEAETLTQLRRLRPPPALAASWREVIKVRLELEKEVARLGPTAKGGGEKAVKQLGVLKEEAHKQLREVAARASLNECGQVG